MKRILALDYGDRRIGVAVSDPLGLTAQPLAFIPSASDPIGVIETLIAEYEIREIVLGWPLNLKGEATAACEKVARFELQLKGRISIPVRRVDERLSTKAAERTLLQADLSREKRKRFIDSQAAAFLLQGVLDRKG